MKLKQRILLWVGWFFIFALLYILYYLFSMFLKYFNASPDSIKASIIAGSFTISVSVFTLVYNSRAQKIREIQSEHRKKKAEIYEAFVEEVFKFLHPAAFSENESDIPPTEEEKINKLEKFFMSYLFKMLIIWGSDDVLKEYIKFKTSDISQAEHDPMFKAENLMMAMRRDIGHDNKGIQKGDLLRIFIKDLDDTERPLHDASSPLASNYESDSNPDIAIVGVSGNNKI